MPPPHPAPPCAGRGALLAVPALLAHELALRALSGTDARVAGGALVLTGSIVAAVVLWQLRWVLGAWLLATGLLLNVAVMAPHGGLMPVSRSVIERSGEFGGVDGVTPGQRIPGSKDILLNHDDIRLFLLSDRLYANLPVIGPNLYSIGDLVIAGGLALAAVEVVWLAVRSEPRLSAPGDDRGARGPRQARSSGL